MRNACPVAKVYPYSSADISALSSAGTLNRIRMPEVKAEDR